MTDVRHITHDPNLAALLAQLHRVEAALKVTHDLCDLIISQAPYKAQSTATDAAWQPIGSVASRVVDQISKREAAE